MNNENTEATTEAAVTAAAKRSKTQREFQTESFKIAPELDEQIAALTGQIFELCEANQIPMICSYATEVNDEGAEWTITQSYSNHKRVPLLFAACSRIINNPHLEDVAHELIDHIGEQVKKTSPVFKLLRELGLGDKAD